MVDRDLARLYEVELKRLNEAVKRNIKRFPNYFMFQLSQDEWEILRSQNATANSNVSKVRYLPLLLRSKVVAMLSGILNSKKAITVNIQIMRAFVQLRHYATLQTSKNTEIEELKKMLMLHIENADNKFANADDRFNKNEETIRQIIEVLNNLIETPRETKKIGFNID